ncbi:hypothetical protein [Dictyobacter kobayashii]|uniref:Uncharacterized protein n=1 Tax=Dictyobacter kobayashii TaxID=2014872 RepID=A0A402ALB6_9CHLR|nr:hypothetical protein [Dictyobacter kobayashii]GCE19988.1 hypothetical protein KDK_37880 [Dictyobacter kobayashii]
MRSKKQIGMYSISIDDDGALQIQAPTLLRPLQLDAQQAQELQHWLNGINPSAGTQAASSSVTAPVEAPTNAASPSLLRPRLQSPPHRLRQSLSLLPLM